MGETVKRGAFRFLKSGTYYLGFFFFYLSLYGITYSLAESLEFKPSSLYGGVTLAVSVLTLAVFAISGAKSETVTRVFHSNAFVFAAAHFATLSYRVFSPDPLGDPIFAANVAVSLVSLAAIPFFDTRSDFRIRSGAYVAFLSYVFLCLTAFVVGTFETSLFKTALAVSFVESVVAFDFLTRLRRLREYRNVSAYVGALFSYLSVAGLAVYVTTHGTDLFALVLSFVVAVFQTYLHSKYENYLSLSSVIGIVWFLYFDAFFPYPASGFFPYALFVFALPAVFSAVAKFKTFHHFDKQFLYGASLLHAFAFFLGYFFRFSDVSVLEISVLSLGSSILLFASYVGMRR